MPPGLEPAPPQPYFLQQPPQAAAPPYAPPQPAMGAPPTQYPPYPPQAYPPQYPPQYTALQGQYPQYPPPPPQYQAPPQYQPPPPPAQPQIQPPLRQYAPRPATGGRRLPTWLMTVLFAVAIVGVVAGLYSLLGSSHSGSEAAAPSATVENPAAKANAKTSPLQKYVEISAIRFSEDAKKRIMVKFLVTNHSDTDMSGLAGNVTIWGRTQKSEEDAVGSFAFKADVPPQASKEVTAPLNTNLKIYELPDWQNVTTDVQITAPQ
jgi:hypothetical protein